MTENGRRTAGTGQRGEILVVEDSPASLALLSEMLLKADYTVRQAASGDLALWTARLQVPDLILLDVNMPGMSGFEVCQHLKADRHTADVPVIFLSALHETESKVHGFRVGGVDYISKPFQPEEVLVRVHTHMKLSRLQKEREVERQRVVCQATLLAEEVRKATAAIVERERETVLVLSRAGEFRDGETGSHLRRMSNYSRLIAANLDFAADYVDLIFAASPMHDIGKIGIPDDILLKPGALTAQEWKIMARHPLIGWDILRDSESPLLKMAAEIALNHHEKWNGSGYPNGLAGTDIPLPGRICALADVFDALTTRRPYKQPWTIPEALGHILSSRGSHFDPACVDAFLIDEAAIRAIARES